MKKAKNGANIGFCGILGIVFIVLKLVGVITWKWVWVLAPLWVPAGIAVLCFAIGGVCQLIAERMDK